MVRKIVISAVLLVIALVLNLTGCATVRKETKEIQIQQLQMRVTELETELQQKDQEIGYLEGELESIQKRRIKSIKKTRKNMQIALKNAGFYDGPIDGKIGKKTKKAIREFQRAKGLKVDGVVGKKTWARLKKYLE